MKYLYNLILVILASLVLCLGCSTDATQQKDSSSVNADGSGGSDVGSNDAGHDVKVGEYYFTIHAKSPDNLPGTFYICQDSCFLDLEEKEPNPNFFQKFENQNELTNEQHVVGDLPDVRHWIVAFRRPNYLFVDKTFNTQPIMPAMGPINGTTVEIVWTNNTGLWGLAPNGQYVNSSDGSVNTVFTTIDKSEVTIHVNKTDSFSGMVTGSAISKNSLGNLTGTIDQNLEKINYSWTHPSNGNVITGTFTLLK